MKVAAPAGVATKRFAVVGRPIAHSRSPEIFAALATAAGIVLSYERIELAPEDFARAFDAARASFDGWNVTAPHKRAALENADAVSAEARIVGAANVLTFGAGRSAAANTDVEGLAALLRSRAIEARGRDVTVLGAGGAARATVLALARLGAARITVTNRTAGRAQALVADLSPYAAATDLVAGAAPAGAAIVINATSDGGAVAAAVATCAPDGWCIDLQYKSGETPFVSAARAAGRRALDGAPMLVAQAIATFRLWYGDLALPGGVEAQLVRLVEANPNG